MAEADACGPATPLSFKNWSKATAAAKAWLSPKQEAHGEVGIWITYRDKATGKDILRGKLVNSCFIVLRISVLNRLMGQPPRETMAQTQEPPTCEDEENADTVHGKHPVRVGAQIMFPEWCFDVAPRKESE